MPNYVKYFSDLKFEIRSPRYTPFIAKKIYNMLSPNSKADKIHNEAIEFFNTIIRKSLKTILIPVVRSVCFAPLDKKNTKAALNKYIIIKESTFF